MRRWTLTLTLAVVIFAATTVLAAAVVRLQGKPTTSDNGTTLSVRGALEGLGPHAYTVRVRATGSATIQCVVPSGKEPPGETRDVAVTVAGEQEIQPPDITAGNALFSVVTTEPEVRNGCPSGRWTAEVKDVTFRTVTLRVFQDGRVVLRRMWSQ